MAPAQPQQPLVSAQVNDSSNTSNGAASLVGPTPSFIYVAKRFVFQQQIQTHMIAIGNNPTREDNFRLQGVQWINDVRKALSLLVAFPPTAINCTNRSTALSAPLL
jgi:CTD kinase subunit beta